MVQLERDPTQEKGISLLRILTGEKHEDGSGGDVTRGATPASSHPSPEGHKHEEEGHDEQGDHRPGHVCGKNWSLKPAFLVSTEFHVIKSSGEKSGKNKFVEIE